MKKFLLCGLLLIGNVACGESINFEELVRASGTSAQATFEHKVLKSELPVVVDFFATWCPPCKHMSPLFNALACDSSYAGRITFIKINYDTFKDIAKVQGVASLPFFGFYRNGQRIHSFTGKKSESFFRAELKRIFG